MPSLTEGMDWVGVGCLIIDSVLIFRRVGIRSFQRVNEEEGRCVCGRSRGLFEELQSGEGVKRFEI